MAYDRFIAAQNILISSRTRTKLRRVASKSLQSKSPLSVLANKFPWLFFEIQNLNQISKSLLSVPVSGADSLAFLPVKGQQILVLSKVHTSFLSLGWIDSIDFLDHRLRNTWRDQTCVKKKFDTY